MTRRLAVACGRPRAEARMVRRGKNKGRAVADVSAAVKARLTVLGREPAILYKTPILTGLRANELRDSDLTAGGETLPLEARIEKNGAGSSLPIRVDLADELRAWIADRKLIPADRLFTVPAGLLRILGRDLKAAQIPKTDERGRTVDVHPLRTTFCTLLNATGRPHGPRSRRCGTRTSS